MSVSGTAAGAAYAPAVLEEIADGVHAYVQETGGWCVNNAGVLLDEGRAPVVVDTVATEARARRFGEAVRRLGGAAPRVLVNTHFHGDHTFGNALVGGPDTVIVAHERARQEMAAAGLGLTGLWPGVNWGAIDLRLPDTTYDRHMALHLGGRTVRLLHPGPAHTTGDTLVWLPADRVLFAGDVVLPGCTPFLLMGSLRGSLRALAELRALAPRVVVGGHGPLAGPEAIDETERYLRWLQRTAEEARAAGLAPLEAARQLGTHPFQDWTDPERLVANLHRAYAEADGGPDGEPLDVVRIFGEMVEFNGGRLPVCHA